MASLAPSLTEQLAESERERQRLLDSLPLLTPFGPQANVLDSLLADAEQAQQYDHDERPLN